MDGTKIQKEFGADLGKKAMVVRRDRRQRKEEGGFPSSESNAKKVSSESKVELSGQGAEQRMIQKTCCLFSRAAESKPMTG